MSDKKRKEMELAAAKPAREARLVRVLPGSKKKSKCPSPCPVYMVLAHGAEEEPSHSIVEVTRGAVVRRLHCTGRGMSFAAMWTPRGPRIVGAGLTRTIIYDPRTSTELSDPTIGLNKMNPILISDGGGKLYALSRSPAVVDGRDFWPWFVVLRSIEDNFWDTLPPPPIFPCRLNPLEYLDPPKVRVAAYAIVDSHIVLSVQQDKGTCAFDLHTEQWEMVHDKNLPFTGQAVPLGDHRFVVACSKENGGASSAVYHMEVRTSIAGKELSIRELHGGAHKGHLLCAMGKKGSFSSFDVRSIASSAKKDRARIVHRTYSLVEEAGLDSGVLVRKQDRQIYKLRDPDECLAQPSWAVAVLTMDDDQSIRQGM